MKRVLFSDLLAACRTGQHLDRRLQTAGVLITARVGLCRLSFVLDTIQTQDCKKQFHHRLCLQIS